MRSIRRACSSIVKRGQIGRKKSFAVAVVTGIVAMVATTAFAFYGAQGSGTLSGVHASAATTSTISISQGGSYTYNSGSAADIAPGESVVLPAAITCVTGAPCVIPSLSLLSWTSTKVGCDATVMPGSFTIVSQSSVFPVTLTALGSGGAVVDNVTLLWNNLAINQSPCSGGMFAFVLAIP